MGSNLKHSRRHVARRLAMFKTSAYFLSLLGCLVLGGCHSSSAPIPAAIRSSNRARLDLARKMGSLSPGERAQYLRDHRAELATTLRPPKLSK